MSDGRSKIFKIAVAVVIVFVLCAVAVLVVGILNNTNLIDEQKAKTIAFSHAGISEEDVTAFGIKIDREIINTSYELEFRTMYNEYDYDINAKTGKIEKYSSDIIAQMPDNQETVNVPEAENSAMDIEKAKITAFSHAGVDEASVMDLDATYEREFGKEVFEIEFKSGGFEYEYYIDANTGEIIHDKKEKEY